MERSTNVGFFHGQLDIILQGGNDISFDLFAKKSLLTIASAVGKPIAIDKATQIKSRPSTTRVKVILYLMEKFPNRIRLQFVDGKSSKLIEKNRAHSMDVVTSNICVQTTTENKGRTPRVGVDAPRVGSGKKIMDSRQ
ncbi:hypothetical protein H5410_038216 [Solanum commersonii]|uniref:Uncharacterized protein n=1 Tax=Solanum commersonii TaxID=4109 RepID=A0A9J5YBQ4_SOLCO|nr:hypothetical protein H5410_038216 [Solanum commersonii]